MTTLSISELDKITLVQLDPSLASLEVLPSGPRGAQGWSPVLEAVDDGDRVVFRIADWTGSFGTKPATGGYIGAEGGYVPDIEDAADFRGMPGLDGHHGWSPLFSIVTDGVREVMRVVDWTGGTGSKPVTGLYVGASGLVAGIANGKNIRGSQGDAGLNGWTAELANVTDGERIVQRVVDWYGGTGTKPAVGSYIGENGYVATPAEAKDVRGAIGPSSVTTAAVGTAVAGATTKTTPVDADSVALTDSAASNALKRVTWANVKATLKAYFDTLYAAVTHTHAISDVTGLSTALSGKSNVGHTHIATDITDFSTAAAAVGHTSAQISGLSEAIDDRVGALLVEGSGIDLTYDDAANTLTVAVSSFPALNVLEQNQANNASNIRLIFLLRAEQAGATVMQDGIVDAYSDTTGINGGASSNHAYDAVADSYSPLVISGAGSNVATSGQAISGGDFSTNVASRAFDGNLATNWVASQAFNALSGAAYIGQDLGLGIAKSIRRVTFTNANAAAICPNSIKIEYSDNGSSWTTAVTQAVSDAANAVNTIDVPESGLHRYWRILANANTAANRWTMSEATFLLGVPQNMSLVGVAQASDVASPTTARIALQVAPAVIAAATINTDLIASASRNGGTTYTAVPLTATQVLSDGTTLYEGSVSISGQPAGSSMVYKIATANAKDPRVSGVVFQWST